MRVGKIERDSRREHYKGHQHREERYHPSPVGPDDCSLRLARGHGLPPRPVLGARLRRRLPARQRRPFKKFQAGLSEGVFHQAKIFSVVAVQIHRKGFYHALTIAVFGPCGIDRDRAAEHALLARVFDAARPVLGHGSTLLTKADPGSGFEPRASARTAEEKTNTTSFQPVTG